MSIEVVRALFESLKRRSSYVLDRGNIMVEEYEGKIGSDEWYLTIYQEEVVFRLNTRSVSVAISDPFWY